MKDKIKNLKSKKLEKEDVQKIVISALLVIALVVQFSFLSYLFKSLAPKNENTDEGVIMKYSSKGKFDYKVYLKPNEFIKQPYLGPGEQYIVNLIDHININYFYNFNSSVKTKLDGNTRFKVVLKGSYGNSSDRGGSSDLYKDEKILSEKIINVENNMYNNFESFDLYLGEFEEKLRRFQDTVKISVDGHIEVIAETNYSGTVGGAHYSDSYTSVLKIPMGSSVISLESTGTDEKSNKVYEGDLVKTNKSVQTYIIVANLVVFAIICLLLRKLFMFTNKTEYERELGKLLKNYDDIIVNISTAIDVSKYSIVEIEEFKELLNLSRELLLPMMNYEVVKGKETWLYVIKDNMLYRYVVSQDKLEEKKNEEKRKKEKRFKRDNN